MNSEQFLQSVGELIKKHRTQTMDQEEFAKRLGCGVNTVYRMENGQGVNAMTLVSALELLGLLGEFTSVVDEQLAQVADAPERKRRKPVEDFSNDF
ncbi:helix-turn-helix domain-containing protein [Pseudidiomarina marina]|uniref:XRE family transcriptional regulator n=1 Tax=Pseudidiomarina marina TaxID=502366 RepID=A0A432YFG7_9GAMM|nr:helix-turn-helix transcriptional regulator [Pseudidiomarina marina]RUO59670.1 XRE family transcriptional regulator [Pseudidiomarina marina]